MAAGAHDLAVTRRRPGAGIGAASGSGVGASDLVQGARLPPSFQNRGRRGAGDGSGSGLGTGSAEDRHGCPAWKGSLAIPAARPRGNPAGGGGRGAVRAAQATAFRWRAAAPALEAATGAKTAQASGQAGALAVAASAQARGWQESGRQRHRPGTGTGKDRAPARTQAPDPARAAVGRASREIRGKAVKPGLPRYAKAVPGLEEWDEEVLGRGFYPDGIMGYYYDDPDQTVDHANPESYLNTPIPEGATFTRLVAKRKDKRIDFNWNPAGEWGDWSKLLNPLPGINNVYWSARWIGQLFVPKDDVYTFKFDPLDDGGRLYLRYRPGGPLVKVIDAWRVSSTRPETRPHRMQRGAYDIQVEYAQRPEFYAAISLKWKSSSFDWEVIGPYRSGGIRRAR